MKSGGMAGSAATRARSLVESIIAELGVSRYRFLDVQVLHVEGIVLDELAASLDIFAHKGGEDGFAFREVFQLHRQESAALGIHGCLPELLSRHFSQAFVALNGEILAAFVEHVIEELAGRRLLDSFRFG